MDEYLDEAERKLMFADYLLSRENPDVYISSVIQHVMKAASLIIISLTQLDSVSAQSPQVIQQVLKKFDEDEPKEFSKFYIELLKTSSRGSITKSDVANALNKIRKFKEWIIEYKIDKGIKKNEETK